MIMPPGTGEMQNCGGDLFFNSEAEVGLEIDRSKAQSYGVHSLQGSAVERFQIPFIPFF